MDTLDTVRYWIGVLVLVTWLPAIYPWLLIHPLVKFWRTVGKGVMWAVVVPLSFAGTAVLANFREALMGGDLGAHVWVLVPAAILVGIGGSLDFERRKYLTTRILVGNPEIDNDPSTLLTGGPYVRVRHPRYVALILSYFGEKYDAYCKKTPRLIPKFHK